ncbi:MAG: GNAT family N-acetyltransferase [Nitrososphaerota archaeon]
MAELTFRRAAPADLDRLIDLNMRLKRLNEEFDPLLKVRDDIQEISKKYLSEAMSSSNSLVVVAEDNGRVVGFLKADIKERIFYKPRMEGNIVEFYLLPEYRRRGLGAAFLEYAIDLLRDRAEIITAEFPSLNEIATEFYTRLKFRGIISIYARET